MKLKRVRYERKNEALQNLVDTLYKASKDTGADFWKRAAEDILAPSRKKIVVNTSKIEKFSDDKNTVVVCGKVLGYGAMTRKVTVCAYQFSTSAKSAIEKAGGKTMSFYDLVKSNPKASSLKLLE